MTSIQKRAVELAEEFESCGDEYTETDVAYRMADLLKQVAGIGGDVEPVAWRLFDGEGGYEFTDGDPPAESVIWVLRYGKEYEPLFTQQALDAARLAGFEAGRNKGWAVRKIESLIQERDAAIARADSAFEDGRRSQQEENQRLLAEVCRLQPLAEQRDAAFERAATARNAALLEVAELCAGNEELSKAIMQLYWTPPRDEFAEGILEMIKKSRP